MSLFDTYIAVDWSGGNDRGAKPKRDAIWACAAGEEPVYLRNRQVAEDWLAARLEAEAGRRVCVGFDFPFGYPAGFAEHLTGREDALALWDWFEARIVDAPDVNNRFDIAGEINARVSGVGPFWFNGLKREVNHLPRKGLDRTNADFPEKRLVEMRAKGSFTCWQMAGAGSVGSQVMMGLPVLARLRRKYGAKVWPFEALDSAVAFVEIWPSLLAPSFPGGMIKDAAQVRAVARAMAVMDGQGSLELALAKGEGSGAEGWILGVGAEDLLEAAMKPIDMPRPPKLRDDCFALPAGVDWTPVDEALARLDAALRCVVGVEQVSHTQVVGRVVAEPVTARRSNPPAPNSAVDGYGFAHDATGEGDQVLPLLAGRAAAGGAYGGTVPHGSAIRVLTGAVLPDGVDTVVLEEDCSVTDTHVAFRGPVRPRANTRKAGEDVVAGSDVFAKGHMLRAQDAGLLAALGVDALPVFKRLRVGVLSTGDELVDPSQNAPPDRTYDANRPMLLQLAAAWNFEAVDLGHVRDDRAALKARLDEAVGQCDVILTSGGASAGDEDHVSALLREQGNLQAWRIALKPGRPLALALWQGVPVFGLPGNPVAAFVCALIFARPACLKLAGAAFAEPQGFMVPAAFEKRKKPGRREYLRARMGSDGVEVFASEGSGRISGLSWSDGMVELPDGAMDIARGDLVRYLPYGSFGL
ncbi:molybdopterin molybdotransferase [Litoreibacter ascidiaceicola]|uniref:Molybdopterin molybdenumtransferase n=1 Tax=Litoreibacter ascidiaceicola TaxID=1486859 RepID=A0A1M5AIP2_9RHOB|nr:molybdopterin-binding protein [Litoreibacter ascidiaceicola]SHF30015.1 molybdopterin molybdotransferase [Litoreibacter ascidiaceicola]